VTKPGDITEKFANLLLAAIKEEPFNADDFYAAMIEGARLAMLRAKRARDEKATDRLADLCDRMDLPL
jgi:intergrase/recombinase